RAHKGVGGRFMPGMSRVGIALVVAGWLKAHVSRNSMACRRVAPPGFWAAPHAADGVLSIRLQSLTPSRLAALRAPLAGIETR
ncbi:TPA: hypothetical protein ACKRU5_003992, partial [Pseudomonas aeruginosa]